MILYIGLSYLVMLGVMIESYKKLDDVKAYAIVSCLFSPLTLPVLIGMMISKR